MTDKLKQEIKECLKHLPPDRAIFENIDWHKAIDKGIQTLVDKQIEEKYQ